MAVPERADRDAGDKIQIAAFLVVEQIAAFAAHDVDRRAVIIREQRAVVHVR